MLERDGASGVTALNGALMLTLAAPPQADFLNNVFQVLVKAPCHTLAEACAHVVRHIGGVVFPPIKARTFRLVVMVGGTLAPLERHTMTELERLIARQSSMAVSRANPDIEVWLNVRSEGFYTLMLRIGKHKPFDKALARGELRPDLCAMLFALARVKPHHCALDPFAGSGAIAATLFKRCRSVIAGDIDKDCVRRMRARYPGVDARLMDARATGLPAGSVDVIITDPPWGAYERLPDARGLYVAFLNEASRILSPGGIVIVLSSQPVDAWTDASAFTIFIYPVRVSGKHAYIYILEHRG